MYRGSLGEVWLQDRDLCDLFPILECSGACSMGSDWKKLSVQGHSNLCRITLVGLRIGGAKHLQHLTPLRKDFARLRCGCHVVFLLECGKLLSPVWYDLWITLAFDWDCDCCVEF
jgi:hypothetical protein